MLTYSLSVGSSATVIAMLESAFLNRSGTERTASVTVRSNSGSLICMSTPSQLVTAERIDTLIGW